MQVTEKWLPFGSFTTYVRIVGLDEGRTPLILLHGGPGSTHNYFELLDELATKSHRQLIMYDQIGCGNSSIPDDHPEYYNAQTWVNELINLRTKLHLNHFHLLGQSWGGMLAIKYLCDFQPKGIESLILSSTLASAQTWGKQVHQLIKTLSKSQQATIQKAEAQNIYTGRDYQEANQALMTKYAMEPVNASMPGPLKRPKHGGLLAYQTAWGPNEFTPLGNLRNYDYVDQLKTVQVPTLIINGDHDLCTPEVAKEMVQAISGAKWIQVKNARHMVFYDQPAEYQQLLLDWLADKT